MNRTPVATQLINHPHTHTEYGSNLVFIMTTPMQVAVQPPVRQQSLPATISPSATCVYASPLVDSWLYSCDSYP